MSPDFPPAALTVLLPLAAAALLAGLRAGPAAGWINLAAAALTFALTCLLPWQQAAGGLLLVDPLAAHMVLLTGLTGLAAAWVSRTDTTAHVRLYPPLFQLILAGLLLAQLSNDLALSWLALAVATTAVAMATGLPATEASLRAAWRLLILGAVGLALALFGIVLLRAAAPAALALSWSTLLAAAAQCQPGWLNLAFACLLPGYGLTAALAPLHIAPADAQTRGPIGLSGLLGGAFIPAGLLLLLRSRDLLAGNAAAIPPGPMLLALGLLSLLLAAFSLSRQTDPRRLFATAFLFHAGIVAFAFGLGTAAALAAGLFHVTQLVFARIAVLSLPPDLAAHRAARLTLAACLVALAGLPPFGLFPGLFLTVTATVHTQPWLILPLGLGLVVATGALTTRLPALGAAPATPPTRALLGLTPSWLALAALLLSALGLPAPLAPWFAAMVQ